MSLPHEAWDEPTVTEDEWDPRQTRVRPAVRIYSALRSGVLTLGALLGIACILAFAVSLLFGVRPLVVVSGSMEPTIPVGSVVFSAPVAAGEIEVGSVVTVDRPRNLGLVTHRLVKVVEPEQGVYEYTLKGDANTSEDPEPYRVQKAGKYVWHVVGLGHVAGFLQTQGGLILGAAAGLVLLALFILDPARLTRDRSARRSPDDTEGDGEVLDTSKSAGPN